MATEQQILDYETQLALSNNQPDMVMSSDMVEYAKELMEDTNINKRIKKVLWGVLSKHHILSNLDDTSLKLARLDLECNMASYRFTRPPYNNTWDTEHELEQVKMVFESLIRRGKDGFERKAQNTQIQQRIVSSPNTMQLSESQPSKVGFLKRLKVGMLG